MEEVWEKLKNLSAKINIAKQKLNIKEKQTQLEKLQKQAQNPNFWDDVKKATQTSKQANDLQQEISNWQNLQKQVDDALEIAKLDQKDETVSLTAELEKKYLQLQDIYDKYEFYIKFNGKYDRCDLVMTVFAGSGGTDAADWAEMLLRMYLKYAQSKGFKTKIVEITKAAEAGIKRAVVEISGNYAYGYLKSEAGVHRLVRISPFDAEAMRHTSFALVEVLPLIEQPDIQVDDKDIKVEVFRASGHGGQKVNKTESAVRLTHLPTKLTAVCQSERSQLQNKETAYKILLSKVSKYYEAVKEEEKKELRGEYTQAAWGNQIRSYVLHPYKLVKDHRFEYETSDVNAVLNGDLDEFVQNYLINAK